MRDAIRELCLKAMRSRKAAATLGAVAVWAGARFGFDVAQAELELALQAIMVYVVAQAGVDAAQQIGDGLKKIDP